MKDEVSAYFCQKRTSIKVPVPGSYPRVNVLYTSLLRQRADIYALSRLCTYHVTQAEVQKIHKVGDGENVPGNKCQFHLENLM